MKDIHYDFGDDYRSVPFDYEVDNDEYLNALAKIIINDCRMENTEKNINGMIKFLGMVLDQDTVDDYLGDFYENELADYFLDNARQEFNYGDNNSQDNYQFNQSDFI